MHDRSPEPVIVNVPPYSRQVWVVFGDVKQFFQSGRSLFKIGNPSGLAPLPSEHEFFGFSRLFRQGFDLGTDFVKRILVLSAKVLKGGTVLYGELVGSMSLVVFLISPQKLFSECCLKVQQFLERSVLRDRKPLRIIGNEQSWKNEKYHGEDRRDQFCF